MNAKPGVATETKKVKMTMVGKWNGAHSEGKSRALVICIKEWGK